MKLAMRPRALSVLISCGADMQTARPQPKLDSSQLDLGVMQVRTLLKAKRVLLARSH
jgi:hypothetical protein